MNDNRPSHWNSEPVYFADDIRAAFNNGFGVGMLATLLVIAAGGVFGVMFL